jgi:16S rRNA (cytosine967-C5)-methyltransferase
MENRGTVVAQDVEPARVRLIDENCARLGVTCVKTVLASQAAGSPLASSFDKVLVDAPCSNTGVLRRRVDLRWRITLAEFERLRATQLQLLQQASRYVRPGGTLVYSTCSLEPDENLNLVNAFLETVSGFALEQHRTLTPFVDGVDGAFVARLRRA